LEYKVKILDLAIIINAAIKILRIINMVDIVSIAEKGEIDILVWFMNKRFIEVMIVKINKDAMVIHQYWVEFVINIKIIRGRIIFSICL
jgi:hypothetical protein